MTILKEPFGVPRYADSDTTKTYTKNTENEDINLIEVIESVSITKSTKFRLIDIDAKIKGINEKILNLQTELGRLADLRAHVEYEAKRPILKTE